LLFVLDRITGFSGLHAKSQHPIKVLYKNQVVGEFIADLIVEDSINCELKAISQLTKIHEAQLVNYLVSTGKDIGLLINFVPEKVTPKEKLGC
jgi:GxxExxY protein